MDYSSFADAYQQTSGGGSTGSTILSLAMSILAIVAWWFIFEKASEAGWQAIIPIYNVWVEFRVVYGAGWKCLLLLVPILNVVVWIMFSIRLAKAFGQGILFALGLMFLPTIFHCVLAFGPFQYQGPQTDKFL